MGDKDPFNDVVNSLQCSLNAAHYDNFEYLLHKIEWKTSQMAYTILYFIDDIEKLTYIIKEFCNHHFFLCIFFFTLLFDEQTLPS